MQAIVEQLNVPKYEVRGGLPVFDFDGNPIAQDVDIATEQYWYNLQEELLLLRRELPPEVPRDWDCVLPIAPSLGLLSAQSRTVLWE